MSADPGIPIAPLEKSIYVACTPERAFEVFTHEVATWWPVATHSVGRERTLRVVVEERVGGRFYEILEGGEESTGGTITAWDPPRRLAYTWHPGREEDTAQLVEMSFTSEGEGTRVALVHSGWERLGQRAAEARKGYDGGWEGVLALYAAKAL